MKRGTANAILVAFAFVGGGVVVSAIPAVLLDRMVEGAGLPRIVPAAAPPLGATVRAVLVVLGGLATAAVTAFILRRGGGVRQPRSQRGGIMSFAFLKFGGFSRRKVFAREPGALEYNGAGSPEEVFPVLRKSDAHPDAPPRSPLSARRELGVQALPEVEDMEGPATLVTDGWNSPFVGDGADLAMPKAPEPLPWDKIQEEMQRLILRAERDEPAAPAAAGQSRAEETPLAGLSIGELAARLERGLARRRSAAGAGETPAGEALPVAAAVAPEESLDGPDAARNLDDALAALRRLAAKAG